MHCWLLLVALSSAARCCKPPMTRSLHSTGIENVRVRDGATIAVASTPSAEGQRPLSDALAASPYRYDNNAPATPLFLWRETGPSVVRRSGPRLCPHRRARHGLFRGRVSILDSEEQSDLFEVIEWVAKQPWSNGKIGGIGNPITHYAVVHGGAEPAAPRLNRAVRRAERGPYRYCVSRRNPEQFPRLDNGVRVPNLYSSTGPTRMLARTSDEASNHPFYDVFWKERAAASSSTRSRYPRSRSACGPRWSCTCTATWSATSVSRSEEAAGPPVDPTCSRRRRTSTGSPFTKNICSPFSLIGRLKGRHTLNRQGSLLFAII